jgi:class 3 adenylate cyclase
VTTPTTVAATPASDDAPEADAAPSASVPFWRRPRRLRRQITGTLMAVSLVAIVLFGALNYYAADRLLLDGTTGELESEAVLRAQTTQLGANRLLGRVAAAASDPGVVDALADFVTGFDALDGDSLDAEQSATLEAYYQAFVVDPINELDVTTVTLDDVLPRTDAGRWIQYHYTLPAEARDGDAPITSVAGATAYDAAMATQDGFLSSLSDTFGDGDLLLIDTRANVVYSTEQRIDVGTNLGRGPYAGSALASLVTQELGQVRAGEALLTDFNVYLPGGALPVLFAATVIRSGNEIVGTLAVQIPVEVIDGITGTGAAGASTGLDDIDTYIVADDLVLQSTPQAWFDDPERYLESIADPEVRRLVDLLGSPVGLQLVDTEPVRAALDGNPFVGRSKNAEGRTVYSSSTSIDVPGATWVVVTEVPLSVARKPLNQYLIRMGLVAAILLPLAALIGFLLARRLTRPIPIAVAAASAVAAGERHLHLPPLRRDEFGDLGQRLTKMAATLGRQEQALEDEYERKRELLLTVLPPHLVGDDGIVSGTGEFVDVATVIAVSIDTVDAEMDRSDDLADALSVVTATAERLATERGIERIRVAADRSLFVAGTDSGTSTGTDGVDDALGFASALAGELRSFADRAGITLAVHIGLSTGQIATGVLSRGNLTYGAWGEPVRRALAISALSNPDEILVDESTVGAAGREWPWEAVDDVVDLDDQPIAVRSLRVPTGDT